MKEAKKEPKQYRGKEGFDRLKVEHFGIQRKIVANMTTESWEVIPHAAANYEPDVTAFWNTYQALRKRPGWEGITVNLVLLYAITQGLRACPAMNGHLEYKRKSAGGLLELYRDINISMPYQLPTGEMMTVNLHNWEEKTLRQMRDYMADLRRRMEKTDFNEVLYEVSMDNTVRLLKKGRLDLIAARVVGANFGKGKVKLLRGEARKTYYAIPKEDRLTKHDIEQGTITVSNLGSVYRGSYAPPVLLEIIPPQICVIGIGGFVDRPGVVTNPDGSQDIAIRKFLPLSVAMDHRALDYGDVVPFCKHLDQIFAKPDVMEGWF
ncbi:MAG: 2-oxo acid dehydrogenase subunit E2 [Oscillospiraceae bacterium]|nr:2-oxo acid dehydrogenase subunit E2 [Oscillospiraceae bacterium]